MPEVRLTIEEYMQLIGGEAPTKTAKQTVKTVNKIRAKKKRSGKKDPKMAKALRKANQMGRTKAGKLRKGYTQARIMKKAHQLRRKM